MLYVLFSFKKVFMHMCSTRQGYLCQGKDIIEILCYISRSSVWLKPAYLHLWTNFHICWELRGLWYRFWLVFLNSCWVFLASPRLVFFFYKKKTLTNNTIKINATDAHILKKYWLWLRCYFTAVILNLVRHVIL